MDPDTNSQTTFIGILHYETWAVRHWLNHSPGVMEHWSKKAQEVYDQCKDKGDPVMKLSEELEFWHTQRLPILGGLYADLLKATLRRVDWAEVAISLLAEVDDDSDLNS